MPHMYKNPADFYRSEHKKHQKLVNCDLVLNSELSLTKLSEINLHENLVD